MKPPVLDPGPPAHTELAAVRARGHTGQFSAPCKRPTEQQNLRSAPDLILARSFRDRIIEADSQAGAGRIVDGRHDHKPVCAWLRTSLDAHLKSRRIKAVLPSVLLTLLRDREERATRW